MNPKKIVISCGPIPAKLDSVKFLTNRFKGGLAFKTASYFIDRDYDVTIVMWKHTKPPITDWQRTEYWFRANVHLVKVDDVYEYCNWFKANAQNYDAFIMAAAVANLAPVNPYEGKFPSHNYKVGDEFDIKFCIAPRAIDIIKQVNPRACLIGYKLFDGTENELVHAAELTLKESKANVIFANRPDTAQTRKLALTQDGAVIPMDFDAHLAFIRQAIEAEYYRTTVEPMTEEEKNDPDIKAAAAIVKLYEQTFPKYGTIAVPVRKKPFMFMTTARGHKGEPVLVRDVDHNNQTILASAKATLNAPTLETMLIYAYLTDENGKPCPAMVVHRHENDPLYDASHEPQEKTQYAQNYLFPGTFQEVMAVRNMILLAGMPTRIVLSHHGDLTLHRVLPVDWTQYYNVFPERYFNKNNNVGAIRIAAAVAEARKNGDTTLELGCNQSTDCQYAYDPYVKSIEGGKKITFDDLMKRKFHLTVCRNAVNYITEETLRAVLARTERFIANTFLEAPDEKVTDREAAVKARNEDGENIIRHALRLPDDAVMVHEFFAYDQAFYESLGLTVTPYGNNSALLTKGF